MALNTIKVSDIRKLLHGLPDDQEILFIDNDGTATEIREIDPMTTTDIATGKDVLTLEIHTNPDRWFGFEPPKPGEKFEKPRIDSNG